MEERSAFDNLYEEEEEPYNDGDQLDLMKFLNANAFDLHINFDLWNFEEVQGILATKFRAIKCDFKDGWTNHIQIIMENPIDNTVSVKCMDHKEDFKERENVEE